MRFSCQYKLAGTKTFRRSSCQILPKKQVINGKIVSKGWGGNSQNWEKSMRGIYIPDGFKNELIEKCKFYLETGDTSIFTEEELANLRIFLQRDQSGAEALIVAYECENGNYRQLFINSIKPHVYVGLKLFKEVWKKRLDNRLIEQGCNIDELCDIPIPLLKKNPFWKDVDTLIRSSDSWPVETRYYYFAKQTCHSANYDVQQNSFRMNVLDKSGGKVVLTKEQGTMFLDVYRSLFPEIPDRNNRIAQQARDHKILWNMFGHPYNITDYDVSYKLKELYAWSAQSTVGEITRIATTKLYDWIQEYDKSTVDNLADTHDSYLIQSRLDEIKEVKDKSAEFMNLPFVSPYDGVKFNMKSEFKIGFNWYDADEKKLKNPLGLQEVKWL